MIAIIGLAGQGDRLWRFLSAYMLSAIMVVVISGLFPALGAYVYHQPSANQTAMTAQAGVWHMDHILALRDGTFTTFDISTVEGIVTFPSFHTALAILTVWAMWRTSWLRWPTVALNIAVLAGTVLEGGHYLVDLIAGGAITIATIAFVRSLPASAPKGEQPAPLAPAQVAPLR